MSNRSKILAAVLGLVLATSAIGGVSAQTGAIPAGTVKPVATQAVPSKTVPAKAAPSKIAVSKPEARKTEAGKTVANKPVASKIVTSKIVTSKHGRVHLALRGTKHLKVTHRVTSRGKIAHRLGLRHFAQVNAKANTKGKTTVIR